MKEILKYFKGLSEDQIHQFSLLKPLYDEWNSRINVISRKDLDYFYVHHVLHSLSVSKVIQFQPKTAILDVGTGGGFPAIPLAILYPEANFLAVDSIGKKVKVVNAITEELGLKNIQGNHKRAEEINEKFDFIISRAVTRTSQFIPWVNNKFNRKSFNDLSNGFIFLKGGDLTEELSEVKRNHHQYSISEFFQEEFFKTKSVIYMPS